MAWLRGSTSMPTDSKSATQCSGTLCTMLVEAFTTDHKNKNVHVKIDYPHPGGGRSSRYRPES